jgi:hypothetical protein
MIKDDLFWSSSCLTRVYQFIYYLGKAVEDNKSPGIDGLGKSFYSRFWLIIGKDLVEF